MVRALPPSRNEYIQFSYSYQSDCEWWSVRWWNGWVVARLGKSSLIRRTSSRKGFCVVNRRQWSDINSFYVFLHKLQFQSALIILIGILFIIQDYLHFIYCYGYSWFKQWVQDVGSFLLKVLLCYLHTCRRSVKRIRMKQTLGALSSVPTSPRSELWK